jgi:hypothetical protein
MEGHVVPHADRFSSALYSFLCGRAPGVEEARDFQEHVAVKSLVSSSFVFVVVLLAR